MSQVGQIALADHLNLLGLGIKLERNQQDMSNHGSLLVMTVPPLSADLIPDAWD
ncbi:hypothetical protein D3C85_1865240 [compost metagenome]